MRLLVPSWRRLALALLLMGLLPPGVARAAAVQRKTVVGRISAVPKGTWLTVSSGGKPPTTTQVDLSHAKITEKGKPHKRYDLREGMKVRVKGVMRGTSFAADTVEILDRASPKPPQPSAPAHQG